jgi:hypothetical protein
MLLLRRLKASLGAGLGDLDARAMVGIPGGVVDQFVGARAADQRAGQVAVGWRGRGAVHPVARTGAAARATRLAPLHVQLDVAVVGRAVDADVIDAAGRVVERAGFVVAAVGAGAVVGRGRRPVAAAHVQVRAVARRVVARQRDVQRGHVVGQREAVFVDHAAAVRGQAGHGHPARRPGRDRVVLGTDDVAAVGLDFSSASTTEVAARFVAPSFGA